MRVKKKGQRIFFECRNCGDCCGPVPFSELDKIMIKKHLAKMGEQECKRLEGQKKPPLVCKYRDMDKNNCFIWPVRPEICRMFGLYEGLVCPHQPQFAIRSRQEGYKRLI